MGKEIERKFLVKGEFKEPGCEALRYPAEISFD